MVDATRPGGPVDPADAVNPLDLVDPTADLEPAGVTREDRVACQKVIDGEVEKVHNASGKIHPFCPEDEAELEEKLKKAAASLCYSMNIDDAKHMARGHVDNAKAFLERVREKRAERGEPCRETTVVKHPPRMEDFKIGGDLQFNKLRASFFRKRSADDDRKIIAAVIKHEENYYIAYEGETILHPLEGFDRWSFKGIMFPLAKTLRNWAIGHSQAGDLDDFLRPGITEDQIDLGTV